LDYQEAVNRLTALRKTGELIAAKIADLKESIEEGAEQTIGLRADELVVGSAKQSEALSSALVRLADDREQLANLETELKALAMAEKRLQSAVGAAEGVAKSKSLESIMEIYADKVRRLKEALDVAVKLNGEVLALHQLARSQDLESVVVDKTYLKILRTGGYLDVLSDAPSSYVAKWNTHVAGLIS
jgi:hypothetical protein